MEFKFKDKVTISEITKLTKEQAERSATRMKKPLIVPVYVAIDTNEDSGVVDTITSPNLNPIFNKAVIS